MPYALNPLVGLAINQYLHGETDSAFKTFNRMPYPESLLFRLKVPRQFGSTDEAGEWLDRFDKSLDWWESQSINAQRACDLYDALWIHETFELPYSGLDCTRQLTRFGSFVRDKIARKALPYMTTTVKKRTGGDKIRVAYISTHIKAHNGARWIEGWIENHSDDIEVYVFNVSKQHDAVSQIIASKSKYYEQLDGGIHSLARYFRDFGKMCPNAKELGFDDGGFDVVIHPAIGMNGRVMQLACLNIAPVQMTAWGHPVTSGLPTMDYYLSGDLQEPVNGQDHYRETLVRLSGSGLCYPRIKDGPSNKTRDELGLPERFLLVAQNCMKIAPQDDFMLKAVQETTGLPLLVIGVEGKSETMILAERFKRNGVNATWIPMVPREDFLAILRYAEVSLDVSSWSGGNTTIEAIHFGTPIVTMPGQFMRGRHSYCFLTEAGLQRFIAQDVADYVRIVSEVVKTRERLPEGSAEPIFDNKEPVAALDNLLRSCLN